MPPSYLILFSYVSLLASGLVCDRCGRRNPLRSASIQFPGRWGM